MEMVSQCREQANGVFKAKKKIPVDAVLWYAFVRRNEEANP
jgi:hypothetical protein